MRPMNNRRAVCGAHKLAAHLDTVARLHRHARRNTQVIDDPHGTRSGLRKKAFMHAMGTATIKEPRVRSNARAEGYFAGSRGGVGGRDVHAGSSRGTAHAARARGLLYVRDAVVG